MVDKEENLLADASLTTCRSIIQEIKREAPAKEFDCIIKRLCRTLDKEY